MFQLPNINAQTDSGKIEQIKDYLFQLVRELNMEMASLGESTEKKKE